MILSKLIYITGITDQIYNRYIDSGNISDDAIYYICNKIIKGIPLNNKEMTIYYGETNRVNRYFESKNK